MKFLIKNFLTYICLFHGGPTGDFRKGESGLVTLIEGLRIIDPSLPPYIHTTLISSLCHLHYQTFFSGSIIYQLYCPYYLSMAFVIFLPVPFIWSVLYFSRFRFATVHLLVKMEKKNNSMLSSFWLIWASRVPSPNGWPHMRVDTYILLENVHLISIFT